MDDRLLCEEAMFTSPGLHMVIVSRVERGGEFSESALSSLSLPPVAYIVERECAGVKGNSAICLALLIALESSR